MNGPTLFDDLPQIVMNGDSPRARRNDPIESHQAADSSNLHDSQQAVLTALAVHKHLAAHELEALLPEWSGSRIRTALSELRDQGRVQVAKDEHRETRFGRSAQVWEVC